MKKTVLSVAGSALIVFSGVQLAAAAKLHHRAYSEYRDSNAYAAPSPFYGSAAEPEWYRYSGGYSDMAGR